MSKLTKTTYTVTLMRALDNNRDNDVELSGWESIFTNDTPLGKIFKQAEDELSTERFAGVNPKNTYLRVDKRVSK